MEEYRKSREYLIAGSWGDGYNFYANSEKERTLWNLERLWKARDFN